jgi:hypothetical protein
MLASLGTSATATANATAKLSLMDTTHALGFLPCEPPTAPASRMRE